jgi:hypothetical protein
VDTANVVTRASNIVKQAGCERIIAAVVHGVLSSPSSLERIVRACTPTERARRCSAPGAFRPLTLARAHPLRLMLNR